MSVRPHRVISSWLCGVIVGTAIIALTSPWFVRSYLPLHADEVRGVWTLAANHDYRWRSEGYANTRIGPLGMPGKTVIPEPRTQVKRIALWGDSQAEGVCVSDADKIFARTQRISDHALQVFPLARSGEDIADWLTQIPSIEKSLEIDAHVFLIVDLPDLHSAVDAPLPPPDERDITQAKQAIAARFPAFFIQAARHLLTEADGSSQRKLRFSIGPADQSGASKAPPSNNENILWPNLMSSIRDTSERPLIIVYAPKIPQILDGKVHWTDAAEDEFDAMQSAASKAGIQVVDTRAQLIQSARDGNWPHGFHNGVFGSGHLNRQGNHIVASAIVDNASLEQEQ